jgi:hypothetical protein
MGRDPTANNEAKGDVMSDAEFEAARVFAQRLIADGDSAEAHHGVASGRRLVAAVYLIAGRESRKEGEAREDYARQLLRLPDEELIAKLQASKCVTAVLEGKRLADASASDVASILAVVGLWHRARSEFHVMPSVAGVLRARGKVPNRRSVNRPNGCGNCSGCRVASGLPLELRAPL